MRFSGTILVGPRPAQVSAKTILVNGQPHEVKVYESLGEAAERLGPVGKKKFQLAPTTKPTSEPQPEPVLAPKLEGNHISAEDEQELEKAYLAGLSHRKAEQMCGTSHGHVVHLQAFFLSEPVQGIPALSISS